MKDLTPNVQKEKRLETEKPILEAFWSWIDSIKHKFLPKSRLEKAVAYAVNNKKGFMNYLLDGSCAISNNLSENIIRSFTLGRKNWLFSGSLRGAGASATVYSIIETAKANGLWNLIIILNFCLKIYLVYNSKHTLNFWKNTCPWDPWVQSSCNKDK